ncbi:branched-chain amino acid ABC transporter permease [Megasphaera sueciensis]|uniref:branched-chain amino acid ABC transporter permease n=1 Tax=Megasphaera sueciensis TaxID=349094 RepID=UPI003CFFC0E5
MHGRSIRYGVLHIPIEIEGIRRGAIMLGDTLFLQFIQQLINGISLGSIYALIALGYTMVYGIMKLINFAHGDVYMVGAYVGFFAATAVRLPFFPSILLAMVVTGILGMAVERLAYKPLRHSPKIAILTTAIGVSLFLEYTTMLVLTPQPRTFPPLLPETIYTVGGLIVSFQQLVILVVSIILMILLTYVVNRTKMGKAMRAVSYDPDAAQLMGINVDKTISFTFFVGSSLAGAAGVLVGIYYNSIEPLMGIMPGMKAFIAAVLGGIGIIPGAMAGGLILGIVEALISGFISSTFRDAAAFAILIIILLIKPTGLLGKNEHEKV